MSQLLRELRKQEEKLFPCVHCGFCLPVCPTYTRLSDEADSPRGRLHLMRAVVESRIQPDSKAFQQHLDRCLGCRACESVCPSGVEYGHLLGGAREVASRAVTPKLLTRTLSATMERRRLRRAFMALARVLRATGILGVVAERLPEGGAFGQAKTGLAMLAATEGPTSFTEGPGSFGGNGRMGAATPTEAPGVLPGGGAKTALLTGCVQDGLLARVNRASVRVLEANGFPVAEVRGQGCCGAIHSHTGDLEGARRLARANILAFLESDVEWVAVNAAGCGAALKEYPHLLAEDQDFRMLAEGLASRVRDISQLLAGPDLRKGGAFPVRVTYDAPCHLLHAQGVSTEPLDLLAEVPGLVLVPLKGEDECCGGAGIYGITHPELGGRITQDKVAAILETGARIVATGNPGCMMQIGAGLKMKGARVDVVHPIELLDESYRRGGVYG